MPKTFTGRFFLGKTLSFPLRRESSSSLSFMTRRNVLLATIIAAITAISFPLHHAQASGYVASAILRDAPALNATANVVRDNRAQILQAYLEKYNSPLAPYANTFVEEADKNNIDWKLVASISGVESYFGHYIPFGSYNGWGFGVYGKNVRMFISWPDAIHTVTKALRTDYMDKWGAQNIYQIGHIYAADPLWAGKVSHFFTELDNFAQNYQDPKPELSLAL